MNKTNIYLLIVMVGALCFHNIRSQAQNLTVDYQVCTNCTGNASTIPPGGFIYGATQSMETIDIVSDFGMRICNPCSKWHKGIDLSTETDNGDVGDKILSIEDGTLVRLAGATGNYKYVSIQGNNNFGYGHLFRNGAIGGGSMRSGDFILRQTDNDAQVNYAIIYAPSGEDWTAISHIVGDTVFFNNDTLITTNTVMSGDAIAPIGNSGFVEAHIHLYRFVDAGSQTQSPVYSNNCKDPLLALQHVQTEYIVDIDSIRSNKQGLFYELKVNCEMENADNSNGNLKYDNVTMNIKEVQLPSSSFKCNTLEKR